MEYRVGRIRTVAAWASVLAWAGSALAGPAVMTLSGSAGKPLTANPGVPAPAIAAGGCGKALIVWEGQTTGSGSSTVYSILSSFGSWDGECCDSNGAD